MQTDIPAHNLSSRNSSHHLSSFWSYSLFMNAITQIPVEQMHFSSSHVSTRHVLILYTPSDHVLDITFSYLCKSSLVVSGGYPPLCPFPSIFVWPLLTEPCLFMLFRLFKDRRNGFEMNLFRLLVVDV